MKRFSIVAFIIFFFGLGAVLFLATSSTNHSQNSQQETTNTPSTTPDVLGTHTTDASNSAQPKKTVTSNTLYNSTSNKTNLIDCQTPDGKTTKATLQDCENVNYFWSTHQPVNTPTPTPTPTLSNNNATPTPTPTLSVTPTQTTSVTITNVTVKSCTSSSCSIITSLDVTGTNFTPDMRIALQDMTTKQVFNETTSRNATKDANYTGIVGTTKITTDFYNLPKCTTLNVFVYNSLIQFVAEKDNALITSCK